MPDFQRNEREKELKLFVDNDGRLAARYIPIRGLKKIIEKTPKLQKLIIKAAQSKRIDVGLFLASLITIEPCYYQSKWQAELGLSLINNLIEDDVKKLHHYLHIIPKLPNKLSTNLSHQMMLGKLWDKAKRLLTQN